MQSVLEEWRPASRGDGTYMVSNRGRVKRLLFTRSDGRRRRERVLAVIYSHAPKNSVNGYPRIRLWNGRSYAYAMVHSLVMEAFVGPLPEGMVVNHKNGVKADNRIENLEYISRGDNIRHAARMGLLPRGNDRPNAKLTPDAVRRIRQRFRRGESNASIARDFGVAAATIRCVRLGQSWSHVK